MIDFLHRPGFLGTHASNLADITLILILITAVMFTIGWIVIRRHHVQTHRWIQTSATILNTLVVLAVMINSFHVNILPGLPGKLFEGSYGMTTLHATVGTLAVLLGIYVVLRANNLMPEKLNFRNYKLVMRISYALYMLATVLGVVVYIETYVIGI